MEMSSLKLILALARVWRVPAQHGDIPNAYVKADKEPELNIFLKIPQGMDVFHARLQSYKVEKKNKLSLESKKALNGLKQAGRLWSELMHKKLMSLEFTQCLTDMCVYWKRDDTRLFVVGVYVDDLLVTATASSLIDMFFADLINLSVKNLAIANKFLGMRINYDDENGYEIDQEVKIVDTLKELGMENARGTRTPIDDPTYDVVENDIVLPAMLYRMESTCTNFNLWGEVCYGYRAAQVPISRSRFIVRPDVRISRRKAIGDLLRRYPDSLEIPPRIERGSSANERA